MKGHLKKLRPTLLAIALHLVGVMIYGLSFLSVEDKMLSESQASQIRDTIPEKMQDYLARLEISCGPWRDKRPFNKTILVIIDALRADFLPSIVNSSHILSHQSFGMPFTESLIQNNKALGMVSVAQTPTVTMPRIKAILSGTYPSFMDLVTNLNAPRFGDPNLLDNSFTRGDRVILYGDDTWLKMFPPHAFQKTEGISSFFATDYTSVDSNVTRRALPELRRLEYWDTMILHYLGVDHIGHSYGGATSKLLPAKLLEMDHVIREIVEETTSSQTPYLIFVTGDHGMTDAGNHGGDSKEETDTAFVFINTAKLSSKIHPSKSSSTTKKMLQIDLAATMSALMGLPIPLKSKGKVSLPVMKFSGLETDHILCLSLSNALHLQKLDTPTVSSEMKVFLQGLLSHHEFIQNRNNSKVSSRALKYYHSYMERIQDSILSGRGQRRSFFTSLLSVGFAFCLSPVVLLLFIEMGHSTGEHDYSTIMSLLTFSGENSDPIGLVFLSHFVLQVIALSATSFIEMENFYWHYAASSLLLIHFIFGFERNVYARQRSAGSQKYLDANSLDHEIDNENVTDFDTLYESKYQSTKRRRSAKNNLDSAERNSHRKIDEGSLKSNNALIEESPQNSSLLSSAKESINQFYVEHLFFIRSSVYFLCLAILRITSSWTSVSNAATLLTESSSGDIRSFLTLEDNQHILSFLVILTFFILTFTVPSTRLGKQHCLLGSGFFWIYLYRADSSTSGATKVVGFNTKILSEVGLDFTLSSVTKARLVYITVILIVMDSIAQRLKLDTNWLFLDDFHKKYVEDFIDTESINYKGQVKKLSALRVFSTCFVLLSCLLLRVEFVPLFGLHVLLEKSLHFCIIQESSQKKVLHHQVLIYLTIASSAFFSQGNTNSISTLDTSSGYTGLESFSLFFVSLLVTISTYGLYIYWMIMMFVRVQESKSIVLPTLKERQMISVAHLILIYRFISMSMFQVISFLLQNHLFIWSVICPKLLYEAFQSLLSSCLLTFILQLHFLDHR